MSGVRNAAMFEALFAAGLQPPSIEIASPHLGRCYEKVAHTTVESALAQAHQLAVKRVQHRVGVYRCGDCGRFHITHIVDGSDTVACSTHWLATP